jgi:hypothetical protein
VSERDVTQPADARIRVFLLDDHEIMPWHR